MLGFFVNILPIRSQINSEMKFGDLLQQVIKAMNEALEHQEYPFDLLVQKLNPRPPCQSPADSQRCLWLSGL